jgi:hypothetical protein
MMLFDAMCRSQRRDRQYVCRKLDSIQLQRTTQNNDLHIVVFLYRYSRPGQKSRIYVDWVPSPPVFPHLSTKG